MKRIAVLLALLGAFTRCAFAHEMRPAYLQLRQISLETYEALWKVPAQGDNLRLSLYVELPVDCVTVTPPRAKFVAGSFTEQWTVKRNGGLSGESIYIAGLAATMTDVLVRIARLDGSRQVARL